MNKKPIRKKMKKIAILLMVYIVLFCIQVITATALERIEKRKEYYRLVMYEINEISSNPIFEEAKQDPTKEKELLAKYDTQDLRVAYLKYFFRKYNSVLYEHAEVFVKKADENGFDYRLLPAIAMQESNLCKAIIEGSYNCWGWGIYGSTVTRFSSYPEAINVISKGIKSGYIDKGLTTPDQIMSKYTPSSNGSWAHGVNTFLKVIE